MGKYKQLLQRVDQLEQELAKLKQTGNPIGFQVDQEYNPGPIEVNHEYQGEV